MNIDTFVRGDTEKQWTDQAGIRRRRFERGEPDVLFSFDPSLVPAVSACPFLLALVVSSSTGFSPADVLGTGTGLRMVVVALPGP